MKWCSVLGSEGFGCHPQSRQQRSTHQPQGGKWGDSERGSVEMRKTSRLSPPNLSDRDFPYDQSDHKHAQADKRAEEHKVFDRRDE